MPHKDSASASETTLQVREAGAQDAVVVKRRAVRNGMQLQSDCAKSSKSSIKRAGRRKAEVLLSSLQVSSEEASSQHLLLQQQPLNNKQIGGSCASTTCCAQQLPIPIGNLPAGTHVRMIRNDLQSPDVGHQQQQHQRLLRVQFASGSPVMLAAAAAAAASAAAAAAATATAAVRVTLQTHAQAPAGMQHQQHHACSFSVSRHHHQGMLHNHSQHQQQEAIGAVRLDLTCAAGAVRAEVAFSGALEPATSATTVVAAVAAAATCRQQQQQQSGVTHFVQVRNPLCVPRQSDFLSTWRTCMVPIVDLEMFAFMKPPCPRWRHLASRSSQSASFHLFSLMCYNILSDQYASAKSYWYCPDWALAWSFRRQGILENISLHMPTIVCLQEVETEQFYSFFLPHLSRRGYDGIFSPKSRAKTMDDKLRKRVDGCAIFWKRSEFRLVEEHVIEFSQQYLEQCWAQQHHQHPGADCCKSPGKTGETLEDHQQHQQLHQSLRGRASSEIFNRVTVRDNIALAVILAPVARRQRTPSNLMVCTSHMHWDPQCSDVKLIQTVVLTSALAARIKQFTAANQGCELPLVLCGDFNSLPNSGVIEFLNKGSVERDHPEFQRLGRDPSLDGLKLVGDTSQSFTHSLDLHSCYSSMDVSYTNYTHEFKGIIDYIFASRSHFRVLDCLDGMADWFQSEGVIGCPHPYVPSDHIPLAVQLEMQELKAT